MNEYPQSHPSNASDERAVVLGRNPNDRRELRARRGRLGAREMVRVVHVPTYAVERHELTPQVSACSKTEDGGEHSRATRNTRS